MSRRLEELSRRKQDLIIQCAEERLELAQALSSIRSSVTLYGAVFGLGRILMAHPMVTAGISSLLASGYAGKLTNSGRELLKLWRFARPLWSWWNTRRRRHAVKARLAS